MGKDPHLKKAIEILFQLKKNKSPHKNTSETIPISKFPSPQVEKKDFRPLPAISKEKTDAFFSNPENIKKLEKKFNENLIGILKYLLERKKNKKK